MLTILNYVHTCKFGLTAFRTNSHSEKHIRTNSPESMFLGNGYVIVPKEILWTAHGKYSKISNVTITIFFRELVNKATSDKDIRYNANEATVQL